ncbi:MAG: hypothetical protein M9939_12885 [Mesorhizobium sp.]|nr:hypothetical protein [Mesorhizobium sp.]MCO5162029.1 hypothetical protein [Mesorhizobium sp.]
MSEAGPALQSVEPIPPKATQIAPFSPMRWKFALSSLTVHFVAACKRPVSRDAFLRLVAEFVRLAPQLRLSVNPDRNGHADPGCVSTDAEGKVLGFEQVCRYSEVAEFGPSLAGHLEPRSDIYDDRLPAFRALGEISATPGPHGTRSLLSIALAHTLFDGADLARTLSGLPAANPGEDDTTGTKPMPVVRNAALWLAAVPMAVAYLFIAGREKRQADDFRFVALSMDAPALKTAADRKRVGVPALLLAFVLRGLLLDPRGEGTATAIYMRIPRQRFHGQEDRFLHARTELLKFKGSPDLSDFVASVAGHLRSRGFGATSMPFLTSRMLAVIRKLHRKAPWLVPERFKGFAPADIIFSVVPALDPKGPFSEFSDAVMFGGTCTGTTPSCIVVTGPRATTLTFWIEKAGLDERLQRLTQLFEQEGMAVTRWS